MMFVDLKKMDSFKFKDQAEKHGCSVLDQANVKCY